MLVRSSLESNIAAPFMAVLAMPQITEGHPNIVIIQ
jgi:hypothetical protein